MYLIILLLALIINIGEIFEIILTVIYYQLKK